MPPIIHILSYYDSLRFNLFIQQSQPKKNDSIESFLMFKLHKSRICALFFNKNHFQSPQVNISLRVETPILL